MGLGLPVWSDMAHKADAQRLLVAAARWQN
jgi:hypothetical protein